MPEVSFALLREGSSDTGLLPLLRELIVLAGADSAVGDDREYKGTTEEKLRQVLDEGTCPDLIFIHRDSDEPDPQPRYKEVLDAAAALGCPPPPVIAVVPVRMTEAWLLTEEAPIRSIAGKPGGRADLGLPSMNEIERRADPKSILKEALLAASESSGRRRKRLAKDFHSHRRVLLERLRSDGPLNHLTSFTRLRADIERAVKNLLDHETA